MIAEWFQNIRWLTVIKEFFLGIFRLAKRLIGLALKAALTVLLIAVCAGFLFLVIFSTYMKNTLKDDPPLKLSDFNLTQSSVIYYWDKENQEYAVTVDDIREYEAKYGDIPDGAFVALRTDWYRNWPDMDAMSGTAPDGSENFPGWSLEAIKYIYEERNAAANGHETLDTDGSAECAKNGDLACERYVLAHGKTQVELLCNLDKLPPAGAVLFTAWPNFKGANGLPCRAWAVFE